MSKTEKGCSRCVNGQIKRKSKDREIYVDCPYCSKK